MTAAIHMFCTSQEAAQWLGISEEQIETMLQRGILREFREGPYRLLKAADVALLAETLTTGRASSRTDPDHPPVVTNDWNVRLPHCAAVATATAPHGLPRPRIPAPSAPRRMPHAERAIEEYRTGGPRQEMERSLPARYRPSRPAAGSVREWFWTGLTQDRPIAIFLLFSLALLLLTGIAAGIWLAAGR
jgi:hypothetical protein